MSLESTYAKPFLTVPEQIRRLSERGMDCGGEADAGVVLERYGYYRLSGYWHPFRELPSLPQPRVDDAGREIRLNTFIAGTKLSEAVSFYEFDHELRTLLNEALSTVEISFRFFIGHRLGRADAFAHRSPEMLNSVREVGPGVFARAWGAVTRRGPGVLLEPTRAYEDWLAEYDRHEKRARDGFVLHFRNKYGPHLPIWVATEVMSFGVMSNLYSLMPQADQEILASRFQIYAPDGRGDRGALANWLNNLRHVRNVCAHHGRLWNRTFDVLIDAPGQARKVEKGYLSCLAEGRVNNKLYGVLIVLRHLLLSIDPERADVLDIVKLIDSKSRAMGFNLRQLGFPDDWRDDPVWELGFALDRAPMTAASLLDRVETLTAPQARAELFAAAVAPSTEPRTAEQLAAAQRAAQKDLLRTYRKYNVVIEIELGETKHYPDFQFRAGKIIDELAEINKALRESCASGADPARIAKALLDWWQTPHPGLAPTAEGTSFSPLDLLSSVSESDFDAAIMASNAMSSFDAPEAP